MMYPSRLSPPSTIPSYRLVIGERCPEPAPSGPSPQGDSKALGIQFRGKRNIDHTHVESGRVTRVRRRARSPQKTHRRLTPSYPPTASSPDSSNVQWATSSPRANGHFFDITADGSIVVGNGLTDGSWQPFRWTKETGMEILPILGNMKVSSGGSVIFGADGEPQTAKVLFDDDEVRDLRELLISDYGLASELQGWELSRVETTSRRWTDDRGRWH